MPPQHPPQARLGSPLPVPSSSHERRVSNPPMNPPLSYAYGAPSPNGSPASSLTRSTRRTSGVRVAADEEETKSNTTRGTTHRRAQSLLRGEMSPDPKFQGGEEREEDEDEGSLYENDQNRKERELSIGRSIEPAAVRYARVAERIRNTGSASSINPTTTATTRKPNTPGRKKGMTDLNNTSVNIANAFAAAVRGQNTENSINVAGRRGSLASVKGREEQQRAEEEEEEEDDDNSGEETHVAGGPAGTEGSKKRKKRTSKHPVFKHRPGETTSEEELSEDQRNKSKRSKKGSEAVVEPSKSTSPGSYRRKMASSDPAYRPTGESEATSEDDLSDDAAGRRRRSKGKGRASSSSNAIPIGKRDNEVWLKGKKRKGRRSRGGVGGEGEEMEEEDDEGEGSQEEEMEGEGQDMGGHGQDYEPDASVDPPSVSFFLRNQSPSPDAESIFEPPASTQKGSRAVTATPQIKNGGYPASSPGTSNSPFQPLRAFTFGFKSGSAAPPPPAQAPAPLDPSFDEFDRTINGRDNRSLSVDDSLIRGSSYDYSEEERIVAALEEQRRQSLLAASPAKEGATGLRRRNRLPGPPGLAGIEEEAQYENENALGRTLGRSMNSVWTSMQDPLLDWGKIWRAIGLGLLGLLALAYLLPRTSSDSPSKSGSISDHSSIIHYVPFFRPSSTYRAPSAPFDSLEELIKRLTSLEGAMNQLSSSSDSDRARTKADHQKLSKMTDQLTALEQTLVTDRKMASTARESTNKANTKATREVEQSLKDARADLDLLVARVQTIHDDRSADANDLRKLKTSMDATAKEIASLGSKVAQVTQDVRKVLDGEKMAKTALEAIEKRLPSKMAVKVDENGKVEVDATFWKHLRDAFVDKKAVDSLVDGKVACELAKLPLKTDGETTKQIVIHEPAKWDEFLEANEAALRSLIYSDIEGRTGSDAIVTRKAFIDTLRREINGLKADFESKANENIEKIGQELLRKVAKQDEMRRKDNPSVASNIASHLHIPFTGNHRQDGTTPLSNDSMSALISSLVDSALLRYSKDVLAKPDYALFTAGGRVVRSITSPTYEANPLGPGRKALAWLSGNVAPRGRPPVTALHPDKTPGSCWPFEGSRGQLGIQLSRTIIPSDVTIEHVSIDVALDGEVSSAPREFELWGVVESRSDVERLARYRFDQLEARREAANQGQIDDEVEAPTSIPPTPNHILLAIGSYDVTSPSPIQTFPVTPMARQLAIPVQVVVLKVLSNHGESAYTCLYRVRVSGTSVAVAAQ